MKCPLCNAPTEVKHTTNKNGKLIRRRNCFNEHTFYTEEVPISTPKPKRKYKRPESERT